VPCEKAVEPLTDEQQQLVSDNKLLAYHVVNRLPKAMVRKAGGYPDAAQAGFLGLAKAAQKWEAWRGIAFSTYAYPCIWRAVEQQTWLYQPIRVRESKGPRQIGALQAEQALRPVASFSAGDGIDPPATERPPSGWGHDVWEVVRQVIPCPWQREILHRWAAGEKMRDIAASAGTSKQAVSRAFQLAIDRVWWHVRRRGWKMEDF
jgi:hypothetical protein